MNKKKASVMYSALLFAAGAIVLTLLLAVSFFIRQNDFNTITGSQNLEATYHALLTVKALRSSPVENHWFLPTVTLGQALDKDIPWGSTVPTNTGDYIYTSFASPGFFMPYIIFKALNIEESVRNLALLNFVLGSIVSFTVYALLFSVLKRCGYSLQVAGVGSILGTTITVFSREVLQSHGIVYWVHSFYQLILILGLYLLFTYLKNWPDNNDAKKRRAVSLICVVFLGAWTEWTGYFFGLGLALLFWFGVLIERHEKSLSIKLLLALAVAALITLAHYTIAVGFEPTVKAILDRFLARNIVAGDMISLLDGYLLSFGLFALIALLGLIWLLFIANKDKRKLSSSKSIVVFLGIAAALPLLENFILLQHANQFSFDRLKFVFPAALVIAIAFARQSNLWRVVFAISVLLASIQGFWSYKTDLAGYASWRDVDSNNKALANLIFSSTDISCSVLLSNIAVRGYANLLFNRGIYEYRYKSDAIKMINKTKSCCAIYLEGGWYYIDLPYYKRALVIRRDGTSFSLNPRDVGSVTLNSFSR